MTMLIVAGLSLKNLKPRVWDPLSPHFIPDLQAVMVSYADFQRMPAKRRTAMEQGLHAFLGVPAHLRIFLDNGSFYFARRDELVPVGEYEKFVAAARPDWYPVPQDFIPRPDMDAAQLVACFQRTMAMNASFNGDGYVPVIHVCPKLGDYLGSLASSNGAAPKRVALGGIVPNLLRTPKAAPYSEILATLQHARQDLPGANLHLFGVGGTATLHIAALLGIDSVDSSGWRNRAARGIVQLPGRGDRMVADLGSWKGRRPSDDEWATLESCQCPACRNEGLDGLKARKVEGFSARATHNLWVLLEEARLIDQHLATNSYDTWYGAHVDNSVYRPLIERLVEDGHCQR